MNLPRFLHLHGAFEGPAARRCATLVGAFAREAEHAIVSGDPARREAAAALDRKVKVSWPAFPALAGKPWPGRLKKLAEAMQGYDLICTHGWGAIDAVMAHTLFADVYKLAPLIHQEDKAEGGAFYRRIALGRTSVLVVSSRTLEQVALHAWQQPRSRVRRIPDAIPTRRYGQKAKPGLLPSLIKRRGELWMGTLGDDAGLPALLRALPDLPDEWQLVIAGENSEVAQLETARLSVEDRVHFAGPVEAAGFLSLLDLLALGSTNDPLPRIVLEAMAAGLPVAAPAVGDVSAIVAHENLPFVVSPGNEASLAEALLDLARNAALRQSIGKANKAKARAEFDEAKMIERYRSLYWSVLGNRSAQGTASLAVHPAVDRSQTSN